jgi:hypothetical protein
MERGGGGGGDEERLRRGELQALKYRSKNCLTKCSMTLSMNRTYLSSVWLGNKYEFRHTI